MIHIGTSGWQYNHWKGNFYPDTILKKDWLKYYSGIFSTVEVNTTFYGAIKEKNFIDWAEETSDKFLLSIKGTRYITHLKKIRDVDTEINNFYEDVSVLKNKIGAVLWQLPGSLHKDLPRLESFCQKLDKDQKNVIEFRHASWFQDDTLEILKKYKIGICIIVAPNLPELFVSTTSFSYIRFHGVSGWYTGSYDQSQLKKFANKIKGLKTDEIFIYFNNDDKGFAPQNALTLKKILKC